RAGGMRPIRQALRPGAYGIADSAAGGVNFPRSTVDFYVQAIRLRTTRSRCADLASHEGKHTMTSSAAVNPFDPPLIERPRTGNGGGKSNTNQHTFTASEWSVEESAKLYN